MNMNYIFFYFWYYFIAVPLYYLNLLIDKKLEIIPVKNILFLFRVGNLLMTLKVIKKATNIFKKSSFTE